MALNSPQYLQETHLRAVNHATSPSCWFMLARQIEQKSAAAHCPSSQKVTYPNQTNKEPSRTPEKHQQNTTKPSANSYRKQKATLSTSHTTLTKSHKTLTKSHQTLKIIPQMGWPPANPDQIQQEPNKNPTKPNKIPPKPRKKNKNGESLPARLYPGKFLLKQNSAFFLPALPTSWPGSNITIGVWQQPRFQTLDAIAPVFSKYL